MRLRASIAILAFNGLVSVVFAATVTQLQGFQSRSSASYEEEDYDGQAQTHLAYRSRLYDYSNEEEQPEEPQQKQVYAGRNTKQQQQFPKRDNSQKSSEEEEEEEEEPDRLAVLLEKSQFNCDSKTTGYYADESVACEVFHYCQDNQRHSWVCPEGFTFHQVHLICMPPSTDNICAQSSKYHIVNDYLYKPVNLEEHQSKPNVSLRYSERYYPESFYEDERYQNEARDTRERVHHAQRQPVQVGFNTQPKHQQQPQPQQHIRKPQQHTSPQPQPQVHQLQHQQLHQQPAQQLATAPPTATAYRFATQLPQHQQVFRSPEEINISLQQRRPQLFIASSTPRYYEDEYIYERK